MCVCVGFVMNYGNTRIVIVIISNDYTRDMCEI